MPYTHHPITPSANSTNHTQDTHQPLKNYEDHESHHQGSNHVLIAPTSLLTLNTRTPKSTLSDAFNPRYFQAYTDAVDENQV